MPLRTVSSLHSCQNVSLQPSSCTDAPQMPHHNLWLFSLHHKVFVAIYEQLSISSLLIASLESENSFLNRVGVAGIPRLNIARLTSTFSQYQSYVSPERHPLREISHSRYYSNPLLRESLIIE